MVLIESMSVGTPLVASHKGGIPEIISPGVDGNLD
jgi:glycosyltransferase involved in cell wall biosynthesis